MIRYRSYAKFEHFYGGRDCERLAINRTEGVCDLFKNTEWYGTSLHDILNNKYTGLDIFRSFRAIIIKYRDNIEEYLYNYANEHSNYHNNNYDDYITSIIRFCAAFNINDITPKHHEYTCNTVVAFKKYNDSSNFWYDDIHYTDTNIIDYLVQFFVFTLGYRNYNAHRVSFLWEAGIVFTDLFKKQNITSIEKYWGDYIEDELCYNNLKEAVFYAGQIYCGMHDGLI